MKKTITTFMMLTIGFALALAGCEDKAATETPDAAAVADIVAPADAAVADAEPVIDEATLKAQFTKEAADSITEENAVAEADALEKELDAELTEE